MAYVGGLRARLIKESLYNMIDDALHDLGWFDSGREHSPVTFRIEEVSNDDQIQYNTLALADDDIDSFEQELGSTFSEHIWSFFLDFYAENDAVGVHMIRDVKDILEGRMSSIDRSSAHFTVWDYTQATPSELFTCEITNVSIGKARQFNQPWQRHWYSCGFAVSDYYADDDDD